MSISWELNMEADFLRVTTSGKDDSLEEVMKYGAAILQKCIETQCLRVLCDERNLQYGLNTSENFDLASHLAKEVPLLAKVAIVHAPEYTEEMNFFENVGVNRGLQIKTFISITKAEDWLRE